MDKSVGQISVYQHLKIDVLEKIICGQLFWGALAIYQKFSTQAKNKPW